MWLSERKIEKSEEMAHLNKAAALYEGGAFEKANEEINLVKDTKMLKGYIDKYYIISLKINLKLGNMKKAMEYKSKVTDNKIYMDLDLMLLLSDTYMKEKDYENSLKMLNKLIKVNGRSNYLKIKIAYCYKELGQNQKLELQLNEIEKCNLNEKEKQLFEELLT